MNDYFNTVKPTYIENWPTGLYNLSIAQVDIPLSNQDALMIGSNMIELFEMFDTPPGQNIKHIINKIDQAILQFPKGAFVRLGSRSPKDSWLAMDNGFKVYSGKDAMRILLGCSERIMEDLLLAIANQYNPHIWLRQWVNIPKWSEFRCFMRNKTLVAISQYNYLGREYYPQIKQYDCSIKWAIEGWFKNFFRNEIHLDDVILDVFLKERSRGNTTEWEVKLIEINPYFNLTDPCLFAWNRQDEFNGQLRYINANKEVDEA